MHLLTVIPRLCDCGQDLDELWDKLHDADKAIEACQIMRKCDLCKEYIVEKLNERDKI